MVQSVIAAVLPAAAPLGVAQAAAGGIAGDLPAVPAGDRVSCGDLLELLTSVSDGRPGQGRDHPVPAVLAMAAGAVVAGMRSFTAIAGWAADAPAGVVAELYQRCGARGRRPGRRRIARSGAWSPELTRRR